MNRAQGFLALGLALGLAIGGWGMRLYFTNTLRSWDPVDRFLVQLEGDLRLTPGQREKVADILGRQKDRVEELRKQWAAQVTALARQGEDEMASLLSGDQAERFIELHDQIHGRLDRLLWTTNSGPTAIAIAPVGR